MHSAAHLMKKTFTSNTYFKFRKLVSGLRFLLCFFLLNSIFFLASATETDAVSDNAVTDNPATFYVAEGTTVSGTASVYVVASPKQDSVSINVVALPVHKTAVAKEVSKKKKQKDSENVADAQPEPQASYNFVNTESQNSLLFGTAQAKLMVLVASSGKFQVSSVNIDQPRATQIFASKLIKQKFYTSPFYTAFGICSSFSLRGPPYFA